MDRLYIANENPKAANTWIETLFLSVGKFPSFPGSGRVVPELNEDTIREIFFSNYRVVYRIDSKQVSILTVRNIRQILPESDSESK